MTRRFIFPLEVKIEGDKTPGKKVIKDIYITELGHLMISVFNEEKKTSINYRCGDLREILPQRIEIKGEEDLQFSLPPSSTDCKFRFSDSGE